MFQCEQGDKLFSDFSTTGDTTGVSMHLILAGVPGNDTHTVNFEGNLINPFTVSYTVTVDVAISHERTNMVSLDLFNPSAGIGGGNPTVTKTLVTSSVCAPNPACTITATAAAPGIPITLTPPTSSIMVVDAYTPNGGHATGFGNGFIQTSVPEPGTTALFGAGLLALGLFSRRRRIV